MPRIFAQLSEVSLHDFIHMAELLDENGQVKRHVLEKMMRQNFQEKSLEKSGMKPVGFISQRGNQMWHKTKQGNWSEYDPFGQNKKVYVPKKTQRSQRSHFDAARQLSKEVTVNPRNLSEQARKKYREAKSFLRSAPGRAEASARRVMNRIQRETGVSQQSHARSMPMLALCSGYLVSAGLVVSGWGETMSQGLSQWLYGNSNHKQQCKAALFGWLMTKVSSEWSDFQRRNLDSRNRYRSEDTLPNRIGNTSVGIFRSVVQNLAMPHSSAGRVLGSMDRHIDSLFQSARHFNEGRKMKQEQQDRHQQAYQKAFQRIRRELEAQDSVSKALESLQYGVK